MPDNILLDISKYELKSNDVFLFDNNIWMYIFCPLGNFNRDKKQKVYSKFFDYVLSRKLHIFINSLILSEFSNRYLRLDFDLANKDKTVFNSFKKDYVGSERYIATTSEIKTCLKGIIKISQKTSDDFNSINLDEVFNLFVKIGFNDSYYINQAVLKNWIIVSDDSDFTKNVIPQKGLKILTANK